MTLIRWKPVRDESRWSPVTDLASEFLTMQREVDRMFDRYNGTVTDESRASDLSPHVDVSEEENNYLLNVELPGVEKKDVKITVSDGVLRIKGDKKQTLEQKEDKFQRIERCFGSFERSFTLPAAVRSDKIEADFKNGVLTISIPKEEEAKPKEIEVRMK
jgi:HSP20 family protein